MNWQQAAFKLVAGVDRAVTAVGKAFTRNWGAEWPDIYEPIDEPRRYAPYACTDPACSVRLRGESHQHVKVHVRDRRPVSLPELSDDADLDYLSGLAASLTSRHASVDEWCSLTGCLSYGERVTPSHVHTRGD